MSDEQTSEDPARRKATLNAIIWGFVWVGLSLLNTQLEGAGGVALY